MSGTLKAAPTSVRLLAYLGDNMAFKVQGDYGKGWETLSTHTYMRDALDDYVEYVFNDFHGLHRILDMSSEETIVDDSKGHHDE